MMDRLRTEFGGGGGYGRGPEARRIQGSGEYNSTQPHANDGHHLMCQNHNSLPSFLFLPPAPGLIASSPPFWQSGCWFELKPILCRVCPTCNAQSRSACKHTRREESVGPCLTYILFYLHKKNEETASKVFKCFKGLYTHPDRKICQFNVELELKTVDFWLIDGGSPINQSSNSIH